MTTTLILIRHAATAANLQKPAKLQGRRTDPELHPIGQRQAEATRDFLAIRSIDRVFSSPLKRALQTAKKIAEPHELKPIIIDDLTECDVGRWEGKSWEEIRETHPDEYAKYHQDPAKNGYLGGETFADVHDRATKAINDLLAQHEGLTIAVVSHHIVNRTYLAGVLGLGPSKARMVSLDNCGISIVTREGLKSSMRTLNSTFHLQGIPHNH